MEYQGPPTKLLFIDEDEGSFEVWQSLAQVLSTLPPLQFYHACDATDALAMIDTICPDVVVLNLDDDLEAERSVFVDSMYGDFPPVVVPLEDEMQFTAENDKMIFLENCSSIEGIHKTLLAAVSAAKSKRKVCEEAISAEVH